MIQKLISQIKKQSPKKILLQLPEGLKTKAAEIMQEIEKQGIEVILSNDPCYGACDLRDREAQMLKCNLIVHVGHNKFYKKTKTKTPVLYFPWKISVELKGIDFSSIKEKKIGLLSSIQYLDSLKEISKKLEKFGKKPVTGGQVLGCWTANAEKIAKQVDAFLFVGTGEFHPLAIRKKKTYFLDLEKNEIRPVDTSLSEKRKYANILKARNAKTFAILISSKSGQFDMKKAEKVKKILEQRHKKAYLLIMDEMTNEKLLGIRADAFINTACPRIVDNKFEKPMINADDIELLFGVQKHEKGI